MLTASLNDPRVPFHEPAKYVAKLRALQAESPANSLEAAAVKESAAFELTTQISDEQFPELQDPHADLAAAAERSLILPFALLLTATEGGHGGVSAGRLAERARKFGFLIWALTANQNDNH